jgi:folate-binding protein YgfZ
MTSFTNLPPTAPSPSLAEDLEASRSGGLACPLPQFGILQFTGPDADTFLQGQLTCDVKKVTPTAASHGAYCTPKGRMLANILLWRDETRFFMLLSRDMLPAVQKRLTMYVLRAKVGIAALSTEAAFGIAGPEAARVFRSAFPGMPAQTLGVTRNAEDRALIQVAPGRFLVLPESDKPTGSLADLSAALKQADSPAWQWLDIHAGIPWITAATQDQLVPQMANLERLGGVSFTKGCYTGQEIVARTQHLGKVKRRMFLAHIAEEAAAGDALYAEDLGDQASGLVVNAAPSPEGGSDVLAVVSTASREQSTVRLKTIQGPALRFLPPPYPLA